MPIVLLQTTEIEYLGYPYTRCVDGTKHFTFKTLTTLETRSNTAYDISICKMLRYVLAIVKIGCFHHFIGA